MSDLDTTARFTNKNVHLFREASENGARTYCGLGERREIWRDPGEDVTCGACIRRLTERVNEIGAKVDSIATGADGVLYG